MRFRGVLSALALAVVAGGCLHDDDGAQPAPPRETVTVTTTATETRESTASLRIYLLRDGKVAPVEREVASGPAVARAALEALLDGPDGDQLETAIAPGVELERVAVAGGVAEVGFSQPLQRAAQAQVVYTLTQFGTVERVAVNGARPVGRAAFEEQTPAILVESPLPGETVEPGFEVTGTANTFEATFNYELRDRSNRVLSRDFVTATSGSGTRGTFRFTVPYEVDRPQQGTLTVFEISAASGARTHEVSIPLRLE